MSSNLIPAVAYIRVSTDEQVAGFSLDAQRERIVAYAKSQDYCLVDVYSDDGYSAKDLNRPAIKNLLEDARYGKFKIILSYKLDRLTRRLRDLNEVIDYLEKYKVKFESITEPFETKSASGRLMLNVFGGFAQFEREVNSERTIMGLQRRFDEGKWMTSPPFGYRMENRSLMINFKESRLVKKIFRMYLKLNCGVKELAGILNERGYKNRRGNKWRSGAIYRILSHQVYIGKVVWKNKVKAGSHKPIIDEQVFNAVQDRFSEKCQVPPRRITSSNVLTGLIYCKRCGASMYVQRPGSKEKSKYRYYVCANVVENHICDQPYLNAGKLEEKIFDQIREVSHKPKLIDRYVSDFNKKQLQEKSKLKRLVNTLKKKVTEIQNKRKKIIDWLAKTLPAKTTTEDINTEIEKLNKKSQKLREDLLIAEARIRSLQKGNYTTEIICGYLKKFDYLYEGFNHGQRKLLVESLVKKVNVESKEKINLQMSLPLVPLSSYIKKVQGGMPLGVVHNIKPINEIIVNFTFSL